MLKTSKAFFSQHNKLYVGTNVNRTNVTGKDNGAAISPSSSGKILTTHCGMTRKSYANALREAVRLPRPIRHNVKVI
jgi:hypothetical protein